MVSFVTIQQHPDSKLWSVVEKQVKRSADGKSDEVVTTYLERTDIDGGILTYADATVFAQTTASALCLSCLLPHEAAKKVIQLPGGYPCWLHPTGEITFLDSHKVIERVKEAAKEDWISVSSNSLKSNNNC
jgi:hypothetical protein